MKRKVRDNSKFNSMLQVEKAVDEKLKRKVRDISKFNSMIQVEKEEVDDSHDDDDSSVDLGSYYNSNTLEYLDSRFKNSVGSDEDEANNSVIIVVQKHYSNCFAQMSIDVFRTIAELLGSNHMTMSKLWGTGSRRLQYLVSNVWKLLVFVPECSSKAQQKKSLKNSIMIGDVNSSEISAGTTFKFDDDGNVLRVGAAIEKRRKSRSKQQILNSLRLSIVNRYSCLKELMIAYEGRANFNLPHDFVKSLPKTLRSFGAVTSIGNGGDKFYMSIEESAPLMNMERLILLQVFVAETELLKELVNLKSLKIRSGILFGYDSTVSVTSLAINRDKRLCRDKFISHLPPNLTLLDISQFTLTVDQMIECLPSSLTNLNLFSILLDGTNDPRIIGIINRHSICLKDTTDVRYIDGMKMVDRLSHSLPNLVTLCAVFIEGCLCKFLPQSITTISIHTFSKCSLCSIKWNDDIREMKVNSPCSPQISVTPFPLPKKIQSLIIVEDPYFLTCRLPQNDLHPNLLTGHTVVDGHFPYNLLTSLTIDGYNWHRRDYALEQFISLETLVVNKFRTDCDFREKEILHNQLDILKRVCHKLTGEINLDRLVPIKFPQSLKNLAIDFYSGFTANAGFVCSPLLLTQEFFSSHFPITSHVRNLILRSDSYSPIIVEAPEGYNARTNPSFHSLKSVTTILHATGTLDGVHEKIISAHGGMQNFLIDRNTSLRPKLFGKTPSLLIVENVSQKVSFNILHQIGLRKSSKMPPQLSVLYVEDGTLIDDITTSSTFASADYAISTTMHFNESFSYSKPGGGFNSAAARIHESANNTFSSSIPAAFSVRYECLK